jgi:hypothetical protein
MKQLFLILLLATNSIFGQVSKKLSKIVKPLEKYTCFYAFDKNIDKIEHKVQQFANSEELEFLALNGKNPYIKAIAIKTLIKREDPKLFDIFRYSINLTDTIVYKTHSLTGYISLPVFFFGCLTDLQEFAEISSMKIKSELINISLDSKPINFNFLHELRYQIPIDLSYYDKIRNLVIETKSTSLLVTLAKYQNQNDIELIKSFNGEAFSAIEEFPDNDFLPLLTQHLDQYKDFSYVWAVSKFCNEESTNLISKILELQTLNLKNNVCNENYCLKHIYDVIYNRCKLHYPALEKLWLSHKILSFGILDNYEKNNGKNQTADFILSGLILDGSPEIIIQNTYDIQIGQRFYQEENLNYDNTGKLVKLLLKLKSLSEEKYQAAISKVILDIDDIETDKFIIGLNDHNTLLKYKENFIKKMTTTNSVYGLLIIMEGVKELGDKKLFKDCFEILKQRKSEFQESKVWEESLKEFLKQNNLKL